MRKITKITIWIFILLFFGASSIVFYVFNSNIWKDAVRDFVRQEISGRSDFQLEIGEISGTPIVGHLRVNNIRLLTSHDYQIADISEISVHYGLFQFLLRRGEVNSLEINGLRFSYPAGFDSLQKYVSGNGNIRLEQRLVFQELELSNSVILNSQDETEDLMHSSIISGTIALSPDSVSLTIDEGDCQIGSIDESFSLKNIDLTLISDSLFLRRATIKNRSTDIGLSSFAHLDSTLFISVDYRIDNVIPAERMSDLDSILAEEDYLNFQGNLELDERNVTITSVFYGQLFDNMISDGFIQGEYRDTSISFEEISFKSDQQTVAASIRGSLSDGGSAELQVSNVDLKSWDLLPLTTSINGQVDIQSWGKVLSPDSLHSNLALAEISMDTLMIDSVKGGFRFADGNLTIIDSIRVDYNETDLSIYGACNLKANRIAARARIRCENVNRLSEFVNVGDLNGRLTGFLEASGRLDTPDFRGWVRGQNIGYSNFSFNEVIARFGFLNIQENRFGDIYVEASDGSLPFIKESIPLASLIIQFDKDTTVVRSLRVVGEDLNVEIQGKIYQFSDLLFDRINVFWDGNYLNNIDPIQISLVQDTISLAEVRFSLNEGMVILSGESINNQIESAVVNITGLYIDPLNAYLKGARGVSGVIDGVVSYVDTSAVPSLYNRFEIRNANIAGTVFKNVRLESRLHNDQIIVENIFLEDNENGYLNGFGQVNCHYSDADSRPFLMPSDEMSVQIQLDNFDFGTLGPFVLQQRQKDGKLSGSLMVSNQLGDPEINYDLAIDDPIFDRLAGEKIVLKGRYLDSKLFLSELLYQDQYGLTTGSGYLPFTLSLNPFDAVFQRDSVMDLSFTTHTSSVEFLSAYIWNLESLEGDYDIALNVTGTPNNPVRSGNITMKNGTIRVATLENPITGVTGSTVLRDNTMEIVSMEGYMIEPVSNRRIDTFRQKLRKYTVDVLFPSSKSPDEPNVAINGTIDFTYFFRPDFNLTVTGDEIYVRTLLAEQEGILDGTFLVSGRDTMNIEGEVDINEFIIRNEFGDRESLLEEDRREPRVYQTINLHTVIPGNLYFRNSQLDCELEGEIWIIRNGRERFRFSGTLDIRKGKFFYYGWEFDVVQGSITFDPTEFNPILDIEARVDLASYSEYNAADETGVEEDYVTVRLSGDMLNPSLEFESDKYNEGDILMFLTRTQLGTEDAFNQERISSDAMNVFGMYFERQLEKSISRISGLDEFELRTSGNLLSNQQPDQWSVSMGQKLAPNLYFKYERNLSLIEPTQLFGVEYRLNRNFSVSGEVEQDGSFRINYLYKYRY